MSSHANINRLLFKHPLGNTPASSLTQDLPWEEDVKLLLLGCGDMRNVLYTVYSERDKEVTKCRKYDFTCVDDDVETIARNVLLLTILASPDSPDFNLIWPLYFDLKVSKATMTLIANCTSKLVATSTNLEQWHGSDYGKVYKMCDSGTLDRLHKSWKEMNAVAMETEGPKAEQNKKDFETRLEGPKTIRREKNTEPDKKSTDYSTLIAAGPLGQAARPDGLGLCDRYWTQGTLSPPSSATKAVYPNPTFASGLTPERVLHYTMMPLPDFHLALGYIDLEGETNDIKGKSDVRLWKPATKQFEAWSKSFREHAQKGEIVMRFCVSDAFAFCHTLQYVHSHQTDVISASSAQAGAENTAGWYRAAYDMTPLVLDSPEYSQKDGAPTQFTIIDTSNLANHLGLINILVSTRGLLENKTYSALYTEISRDLKDDGEGLLEKHLLGDPNTIGLLLDLVPVSYQTPTISSCHIDEFLLGVAYRFTNTAGSIHSKNTWKIPLRGSSVTTFAADNLARVLHKIYRTMFAAEDFSSMFDATLKTKHKQALADSDGTYHRASFVALVAVARVSIVTDWPLAMQYLTNAVLNDSMIILTSNTFDEMMLQFHHLGLVQLMDFSPGWWKGVRASHRVKSLDGAGGYVTLTMVVPRKALAKVETEELRRLGSQAIQISLLEVDGPHGGSTHGISTSMDLAFGQASYDQSSRHFMERKVTIEVDGKGWSGTSDLIVTAEVPIYLVGVNFGKTTLSLDFVTTVVSTRAYTETLGKLLSIYATDLTDSDRVFITPHRAGMMGPKIFVGGKLGLGHSPYLGEDHVEQLTAFQTNGKVSSMVHKIAFQDERMRKELSLGSEIRPLKIVQAGLGRIELVVGKARRFVNFSVPILFDKCRARVSRRGFWAEITVDLSGGVQFDKSPLLCVTSTERGPTPWNIHRVKLDNLPEPNNSYMSTNRWLNPQLCSMFTHAQSGRRHRGSESHGNHGDPIIHFKECMYRIIAQAVNLKAIRTPSLVKVFGLSDTTPGSPGVNTILIVNKVKYDPPNNTIVLDVAVLPLNLGIVSRATTFLQALDRPPNRMATIPVVPEEGRVWRQVLPAFVERCRDWSHDPEKCEYLKRENGREAIIR